MPPLPLAVTALPLQIGLTGDFLWLGIVFVVIALAAGLAGFRGLAGLSMSAARLFVFLFLVLAVVAFLL
jgi:uncharacterized membrane protein YtjA (UPF0391 family)